MCQSAGRWYGLPPQSPVFSRTPGSLTVTPCVRIWTSARCHRTQRPYGRPPHPRGLPPHCRTQQHVDVASEGEFRPAPRLTMPTSQDASLRQHVPEGRNFGDAYWRTSPRVSIPAQTLDSYFASKPRVVLATGTENPRNPLCSRTGTVPGCLGASSAWTKHAGHRPGSSRQRQSRKARETNLGSWRTTDASTLGSSSNAIWCTSWFFACRPLPARLQISHTILTQTDWCAVRAVARCEPGLSQSSRPWSQEFECLGTDRSL